MVGKHQPPLFGPTYGPRKARVFELIVRVGWLPTSTCGRGGDWPGAIL